MKTVRVSPALREHGAFVRALIARYGPRQAALRRLSLPVLHRAVHVSNTVERHLHAALTLTWRLNVLSRHISAAAGRAASGAAARPMDLTVPSRATATPSTPPTSAIPRGDLRLRLVSRMTRVDVRPSAPLAPAAAHAPLAGPAAAPRRTPPSDVLPVVKSAGAFVAAQAPAMATRRDTTRVSEAPEARTRSAAPARGPATPAVDAAELQRLASRVIAAIDDRIVAARERLGSC